MDDSRLRFRRNSETRCSICARSITLELSKTDERGRAVHEVCYVKATLEDLRNSALNRLFPNRTVNRSVAVEAAATPEIEMSIWTAFEFVRW